MKTVKGRIMMQDENRAGGPRFTLFSCRTILFLLHTTVCTLNINKQL